MVLYLAEDLLHSSVESQPPYKDNDTQRNEYPADNMNDEGIEELDQGDAGHEEGQPCSTVGKKGSLIGEDGPISRQMVPQYEFFLGKF